MPSFDIVSEVNMQEVDNAVNQAQKEAMQRYDFKGKKFEIELDKDKYSLRLVADEESRIQALCDIVTSKLFKRGIELASLELGKIEQIGGMLRRQSINLKNGLSSEDAKAVVKLIKEMKLKVDPAVMDKQVRVSGKKIDDLQEIIQLLRQKQSELKIPLQFVNMRA